MSSPAAPVSPGTSTRPYLIRALHDWCTDNGFTPYLAVLVDANVRVPNEYVKNNEIVLNVGFEATSALKLGNEFIEFKARFGGSAREIVVPVTHVIAIYARENGQGMAFPSPSDATGPSTKLGPSGASLPKQAAAGSGPHLALAERPAKAPAKSRAKASAAPPLPDPPEPPVSPRPSLKRVK